MVNLDCGDHPTTLETSSTSTPLDYTPILISVLLAVLILVIGYLVAFTFRTSIKAWMVGRKSGNSEASAIYGAKDKLFDVFISYAVEDAEFVEQTFAQNLEHGTTSYRLCLHQRDFPPTTPIADTVSVAVETSTKAIVVLSQTYVANQWPAIRQSFMEAIAVNNTKVVFICLEPEVDLGTAADLKNLLEDSPVVRWGDPGFWNKLRYFLPEPVYLTFHRNVTMRGTLQTSNLYQPVLGSVSGLLAAQTSASELGKPEIQFRHEQPYGPGQSSVYSSEHTYHSIDNNHIYHTLDPGSNPNLFLQLNHTSPNFHPLPNTSTPLHQSSTLHQPHRVFINQNLDLVAPMPKGPMPGPQVHTMPHRPVAVTRTVPVHHGLRQVEMQQQQQQQQQEQHNQPQQHNQQQQNQQKQQGNGQRRLNGTINHAHTNSTSSAKRLLSGEEGEYIV